MALTRTSDGMTKLVALVAFAALLAMILLARPWAGGSAVLRPDTGTRAASLSPDDLRPVLTELLTRVYTAFGAEEEFAIHDGLADAVASSLVTELYLQRRAAQETEYAEGGSTEIVTIELNGLAPVSAAPDAYVVDADWLVAGIVGHEDHRHERLNAYSARLTIGPADGAWKLTHFDLNSVRREDLPPLFFGQTQ